MPNTILIVDDEPNILRTLTRLFEDNNYHVLSANSGKEALELFSREKIQVIISDQRMPQMTGSELLAIVKKLYPETINMILSAYTDFDALKDAINGGGIFRFINKPWEDDALLDDVAAAFKLYERLKKEKENERELHDAMYLDKLTGLCNRLSFSLNLFDAITNAKKSAMKLALLYIDLDHFGVINNNFGFDAGDTVLQEIASRLLSLSADNKHVARLGNNQFAIIYLYTSLLAEVGDFIVKLSKILAEPFFISEKKFYITASIGVSLYPDHGLQPEVLRHHANLALLHSKELGGNNSQFYDISLNKALNEQLALETQLFDALKKKEFILYYQPTVDIETGKIICAEALLRWDHPEQGILSPDKFIHLCEKTGLIIDIGEWVLRTACEQVKRWCQDGYPEFCVAVNLSQRQFNDPHLLDLIKNILITSGIEPKNLELEITESMLMQNIESNINLLRSLRALGIKLALDDFGTGYSSLSYLKQFPFHILKIDKSFIQDITTAKDSEIITTAIIAMAKSLRLTLIAEGVETQEQLTLLNEKKCDMMQGYLFSKPIPAREFTQLLERTQPQ